MRRGLAKHHVLLVEDDPGDAQLVRIAWSECALDAELHAVRDGVEAIDFLVHNPPFETVPRPDLILLDLNMPRMDGRDLLGVVKSDPALSSIPICVLTTSAAEHDVGQAYALGANAYVPKPLSSAEFVATVRCIEAFWLQCAITPSA